MGIKFLSYHDGLLLDGDRKSLQLLRERFEEFRPPNHQVLLLLFKPHLLEWLKTSFFTIINEGKVNWSVCPWHFFIG
jgi:hypothetical protein